MQLSLVLVAALLAQEPAASPSASVPLLRLDDALREAAARNLDLKQSQERLAQARLFSRRVLAGYLPTLAASGAYTRHQREVSLAVPAGFWLRDMSGAGPGIFDRQAVNGPDYDPARGPPSIPDNPPGVASETIIVPAEILDLKIQDKDQLGAELRLTQAILVPSLWPAFQVADLGAQLAAASVESARQEVLFAVAQLYYGAVSLKEAAAVQRRLLENTRVHESIAQARVEGGTQPRIALLRAQIDRAQAEQELQRAERSYASARIALGTLLDRRADFDVAHPPEPALPGDESALPDAAPRRRPDVHAARLGYELAGKRESVSRFDYLPNVVATATYQLANVKGFSGEYGQWAVGLLASWTLWDGGLREVELDENASKTVEAAAALRSAENKARDETRNALLDLESARANRRKALEQVKLARENMQIVTATYEAGTTTHLEVSDANTALAGAEMTAVAERLNAEVAALRVLKASGRFPAPL